MELSATRTGSSEASPTTVPASRANFATRCCSGSFASKASRSTPGNGLGLSLAEAIARLHDSELVLRDHAPGLSVAVTLASN